MTNLEKKKDELIEKIRQMNADEFECNFGDLFPLVVTCPRMDGLYCRRKDDNKKMCHECVIEYLEAEAEDG